MNRRLTALILTLALVLALGAGAASADDATPAETAAETTTAADTERAEPAAAEAAPQPDAEGALSFTNLRGRMLANYYPLLALQENIDSLNELDYEKMKQELRDGLNLIAAQQGAALQTPIFGPMLYNSYESQYNALHEQYEAVRDGDLQEDNAGVVRQLRNLQDQTVIVAESLYITFKGLEAQDAALTRTIASLKRTEREMKLRQELGQVAEITVAQVSLGRAQAESKQKTLRMSMDNVLLQLKAMTGTDLDASLALGALPAVTAQQLAAMDLETDLAKAKEASYELYDAKKAYDDAKEDYDDAVDEYGSMSKKNEFVAAKHSWQAAQYTYENAKQNYELKFRTLYTQVKDYAQALETARLALSAQEKSYAAAALKYEQGNLSANALADAKDELSNAKDSVTGAERDLFASYRSYYWAVEYGILNS